MIPDAKVTDAQIRCVYCFEVGVEFNATHDTI